MSTAAPTLERDQADEDSTAETAESAEAGMPGSKRLGRALDAAGIVAGVVLGVILFDILSGGKLTRWARARRGPGTPEGPCEDCGQDDGVAE